MRNGITAVELSILECTWGAWEQREKPQAGDSADNPGRVQLKRDGTR